MRNYNIIEKKLKILLERTLGSTNILLCDSDLNKKKRKGLFSKF